MFDDSIAGMMKWLLKTTKGPSRLLYVTEMVNHQFYGYNMEELTCFLPGTLALGALTHPLGRNSSEASNYLQVAEGLTRTCHEMSERQPTRLPAEASMFDVNGEELTAKVATYLLRPETVESYYYLHQVTGNETYREWSWNFFQAIERYASVSTYSRYIVL